MLQAVSLSMFTGGLPLSDGIQHLGACVVPVGLAFTHREKFRSDLCMSYCKPIVVDAAYAARFGDSFEAAKALPRQPLGG